MYIRKSARWLSSHLADKGWRKLIRRKLRISTIKYVYPDHRCLQNSNIFQIINIFGAQQGFYEPVF